MKYARFKYAKHQLLFGILWFISIAAAVTIYRQAGVIFFMGLSSFLMIYIVLSDSDVYLKVHEHQKARRNPNEKVSDRSLHQ